MANAIATNDKLISIGAYATAETPVLDKLQNDISNEFASGDGATVRVEVVSYPVIADGATSTDDEINIKDVDVTLGMWNTKYALGAIEKALDIESWDRQIAKPTGVSIASYINKKVIAKALATAEHATVSTGTFAQLGDLNAKIRDTKFGADMFAFGSSYFLNVVRNSGINLFGQSLGEKLYKGEIGEYDMVPYFASSDMPALVISNLPVANTSTVTSAVTAAGATQITIGGLASATGVVKKGTIFGITGVNSVNLLGEDTGNQRAFIVQEDVTAVGSAATVKVSPIYFKAASGKSDPRQNVSVTSIASGSVINWVPQTAGTYAYAVVIDPKAMVYAAKPLAKYEDQGGASESMMAGSVSVRVGRFSNGDNGGQRYRFDGLFGVETVLGKGIGVTMFKI